MGSCQSKTSASKTEDRSSPSSGNQRFPEPLQVPNRHPTADTDSTGGATHDSARSGQRDNFAQLQKSKGELVQGKLMNENIVTKNVDSHIPGYSSGASTPTSMDGSHKGDKSTLTRNLNDSQHSLGARNGGKILTQSSSVLGLEKLINDRPNNDLRNNMVHMEVPFGKPIEDVYDGVHDGNVLGSGVSGLVRLCVHKATGAKYAVKCLDLGLVETEEGLQQLREEIAIMCQLDHPNIVRLEEVYESHSEIYLVQELCLGGELFDRLDDQPDYHYTETQCARLIKQMLCSVRYIHSKGIIHRDLKLENFLFSTNNPDSELKMIDFGLSKHFKFGEVQHEAVGTPYTVAPEVIRGNYDERCDVWAIGVIAFLLLSGDPPFGGCGGPESLAQVRENILKGSFRFEPIEIWSNVSQSARDFIRKLLVTDPRHRPTARECQKLDWLQNWAHKNLKMEDNKLNPNVVKALVNFKEYSDMRKLLCEVLSFTLMPDQITDLRKEFEKLDTDDSGEISLKGLKQVLIQNAGAGSLGALTETEVEDIFNAMRVRKSETRIHWHEFIAAGLSQCKVDERNLKLAFDRLDSDHKGYITFQNISDMMGRDADGDIDAMRAMWGDSMKHCNCKDAQITYEDFLLLMKGQNKEDKKKNVHKCNAELPSIKMDTLSVLHEDSNANSLPKESSSDNLQGMEHASFVPTSPAVFDDDSDGPIFMEDEDFAQPSSVFQPSPINRRRSIQTDPGGSINLSPKTPESVDKSDVQPVFPDLSKVSKLEKLEYLSRHRSRSLDDGDNLPKEKTEKTSFLADSRRAMLLPEHTHEKEIESIINDESQTPLVVNRKLYRAHRIMRLAVVEASKRFEEEQLRRTKQELRAQQEKKDNVRFAAGLVMRHGHSKELSSDSIRKLMKQRQQEQESQLEKATMRGGRGRRTRKKTISDMSAMMSAQPKVIESNSNSTELRASVPEADLVKENKNGKLNFELHDTAHRKATVPGQFRKVDDPFSQMGGFLGMQSMNKDDVIEEEVLSEGSGSNPVITQSASDGNIQEKIVPESPRHHPVALNASNADWPPPAPL
eukprot:CAMPEP_0184864870 /NCGR_PEP_ID=MMETSP0580-20130426/16155_1 /TAXON_ID=1118495 /ORGANISM="Dactyliosolen fragilissimus" /LENGTH=1062 /DNA_ID=CAMNT_0027363801 /DNA_START=83 /DNA_END=3271 /DNA_ORIENTATION=+